MYEGVCGVGGGGREVGLCTCAKLNLMIVIGCIWGGSMTYTHVYLGRGVLTPVCMHELLLVCVHNFILV